MEKLVTKTVDIGPTKTLISLEKDTHSTHKK